MYKYIDLFCGIGGFRLGMDSAGFKCVFSAEVDNHACMMYEQNFGENPYCDITKLDPNSIPDFDVLCAGFPCQSFSIGGKRLGFYDETRGTLFFDILRILDVKRPRAFILENVKNLLHHDNGNTLSIMLESLASLGYTINYKVLNAKDFGVPQNRERIILIGNLDNKIFDFESVKTQKVNSLMEFLDKNGSFDYIDENEYTLIDNSLIKRQKSDLIFVGYKNKKIRKKGIREGTNHLSRVHKQPNRIYSAEGVNPTLSSQETAGRYYIYVNGKVRKLTMDECYRIMGFPETFIRIGSKSDQYLRIGNSVCVNMIRSLGAELINMLEEKVDMTNPKQVLEYFYQQANSFDYTKENILNEEQTTWINNIVEMEETSKAVYTVLLTSLIYKYLYPEQDIRYHQANLPGGYSGRSFDTKYITPFLKEKKLPAAMKESGWLTRSLEQNTPYDLDYNGKIQNKKVKSAFLNILNEVEVFKEEPEKFIINLLSKSISNQKNNMITLINPIDKESELSISDIISMLNKHFYTKYTSRGASILPVIAFQSIYELLINELNRYDQKILDDLGSHYSSDRSSKQAGDIVVKTKDGLLYEVVEVKFEIKIDEIMIVDAYNKFKNTDMQRYYILSTIDLSDDEKNKLNKKILEIRNEHGCQVIVNGLIKTLNYYLRLIENPDEFVNNYIKNLNSHPEINKEHLISWNNIVKNK